jgi:hypothetical protein
LHAEHVAPASGDPQFEQNLPDPADPQTEQLTAPVDGAVESGSGDDDVEAMRGSYTHRSHCA